MDCSLYATQVPNRKSFFNLKPYVDLAKYVLDSHWKYYGVHNELESNKDWNDKEQIENVYKSIMFRLN